VTGVDVNGLGVEAATASAAERGLADRVRFVEVDASGPLPFADASFDAVLCIDSANHLPDRPAVLSEWRRVLRPGGRLLWTDPVVIAGPVTNEELAVRSSIGLFVFVPPGVNEQWIEGAGLALLRADDETEQIAGVAARWHDSRGRHREALLEIETEEQYNGLQAFFCAVRDLTSERRLLRIAYLCERPAER
jgi:SAM-dependent methyltransferase